jgi:hypothetical protein
MFIVLQLAPTDDDSPAQYIVACALYASLLRLPACVGGRETDAAGPVASGARMIFGKEEDPVGDIAAAGDGAQGGRAVEATVDAAAAVAAERPGLIAGVWFAVGADKCPGLAHRSASCPTSLVPRVNHQLRSAPIIMNAITHGSVLLFRHPCLVPFCTMQSPAFRCTSFPSSNSRYISPDSTIP